MRESLFKEIQDGVTVDEYKDLAKRIHQFQEETETSTKFTVTALRHIADRMKASMGQDKQAEKASGSPVKPKRSSSTPGR